MANLPFTKLIVIQETGSWPIPVDMATDCSDLFELVTGEKGIPQDKGQRLYVLSLREDRLLNKIRKLYLIPTECMTADALTKRIMSAVLMFYLTTGLLMFFNVEKHPIKVRRLLRRSDFDDDDLYLPDDHINKKTYLAVTGSKTTHLSMMSLSTMLRLTAVLYSLPGAAGQISESSGIHRNFIQATMYAVSQDILEVYFWYAFLCALFVTFKFYRMMTGFFKKNKVDEPCSDDPMDVDASGLDSQDGMPGTFTWCRLCGDMMQMFSRRCSSCGAATMTIAPTGENGQHQHWQPTSSSCSSVGESWGLVGEQTASWRHSVRNVATQSQDTFLERNRFHYRGPKATAAWTEPCTSQTDQYTLNSHGQLTQAKKLFS
jgi:hypothetical protein